MGENSLEEDITKIEGLKYLTLQATINEKFICAKIPEDYIEAIEHILSDYKRVLKENKNLKSENKEQKELIERMKTFLLKENKMCDFLESE